MTDPLADTLPPADQAPFDTGALQRDFGIALPTWETGLESVLDQLAA